MFRFITILILAGAILLFTAGGSQMVPGYETALGLLPEPMAARVDAFLIEYGRWVGIGSIAALLILLALVAIISRRNRLRRSSYQARLALAETTRGPKRLAWLVVILFFGVGGVWAYQAPLSAAAIAPGVVSPEGRRVAVRHLEGGVVSELLVQEGQFVEQGELLAVLSNVGTRATTEALEIAQIALTIDQALWLAEENGRATLDLPASITEDERPETRRRIEAAQTLLAQRIEARTAQEELLTGRSEEIDRRIEGNTAIESSLSRQLEILKDELSVVEDLFERGLVPRPRIANLQREEARLQGEIDRTRAERAQLEETQENLELEKTSISVLAREEAGRQLVDIRGRLNQNQGLLEGSADELARTEIRAPSDGVVIEMQVAAPGEVLAPGEPLLDLVQTGRDLIVEARVTPADIDDVREGQEARVVLSAYRQRNLAPVLGTVTQVSADRLTDPVSNEPYFLAIVDVPTSELERAQSMAGMPIELFPGMPASVMIVTAERTMANYLFSPFVESMRRSFRES